MDTLLPYPTLFRSAAEGYGVAAIWVSTGAGAAVVAGAGTGSSRTAASAFASAPAPVASGAVATSRAVAAEALSAPALFSTPVSVLARLSSTSPAASSGFGNAAASAAMSRLLLRVSTGFTSAQSLSFLRRDRQTNRPY